jgi:hypothetical protein
VLEESCPRCSFFPFRRALVPVVGSGASTFRRGAELVRDRWGLASVDVLSAVPARIVEYAIDSDSVRRYRSIRRDSVLARLGISS